MTTENPVPPTETGAPAADAAKSSEHMIPQARLNEELSKRRALEEQVSQMADAMLAAVPDNLKVLIPAELPPAAKVAWFLKAKETGVFGTAPNVPATDNSKPTITPRESDLSNLPPASKMAAAYRKG